ncbi:MAG: tetratricopeptide repeat protein [bacterium]|nr:tetratricopeptide repeat protein [bacterium]
MKRLNFVMLLVLFVVAVLSPPLFSAREDADFNKGIAYLLIDDMEQAGRFFGLYFGRNPNPNLRNGYRLLVEGEYTDATRQFKGFLDLNHRSTIALVGIALSTSHMTVSNTGELLKRATRLSPRYSPSYLCLGVEYLKEKDYPRAESNFRRALGLSPRVPEYKILLARLYLQLGQPAAALKLVKQEADRAPDNFYFNYLTARAYLKLDRVEDLGQYIQAAMEAKPKNNEVKLLTAKYHLSRNNGQRAKTILKGIKFDDYNEDYLITYGRVLVALKEKKARNYLYEVFARKKWDRDVSRLMGLCHMWMAPKGNVQNWIYRAILSGGDSKRLKETFPGKFEFPEYKFLPFFDVKRIEWLSDETLLVVATRKSGERQGVFIVDLKRMRVTQQMIFNGKLQEIFISPNHNSLILSSVARENESVYLYAMGLTGRVFRLALISRRPLSMASVEVGFNSAGTLAYITDHKISKLAFDSPFSMVSQFGQKKPVYPAYPFYIFKYNFATRRLTTSQAKGAEITVVPPLDTVKKYAAVANSYYAHTQVRALIEKGRQLDLTSSEMVKIYFARDMNSFIIYLSDINNAFRGVAWDAVHQKVVTMDQTMFLGAGEFAELNVLDYDPHRKEILVLTKNEKDLILYNYETHLHMLPANNVYKVHYDREDRMIYVLNRRNSETSGGAGLQVISLDPFLNKKVGTRVGLTDIIDYKSESEVYFETYDGEVVKMDETYNFTYVEPSLQGSLHAESFSSDKTAVFINGKLWIIE